MKKGAVKEILHSSFSNYRPTTIANRLFLTAFPFDQSGIILHVLDGDAFLILGIDLLQHQLGSFATDFSGGHFQGGQGGLQHIADFVAGEADDFHIPGYLFLLFLESSHGADSLSVHSRQDGIQFRMLLQHLQSSPVSIIQGVGEALGFRSDFPQPQFIQGSLISLMPKFIER